MTPLTHQHEPSISGARALTIVLLILTAEFIGALFALGGMHG